MPNCAATRHVHFTLDKNNQGKAVFEPPALEDWPDIPYDRSVGRRVNLATVTR